MNCQRRLVEDWFRGGSVPAQGSVGVAGRLTGARALITGASGGIGSSITSAFLAEGASVVAVGRSGVALESLAKRHGNLHTIVADVGVADAAADAVARSSQLMGGVNVVVNAAAVDTGWARTADISVSTWDETIRVNLSGTYYVCRAAIPLLVAAGGGSIINVTSIGAKRALESDAAYNASKAGVELLTRTIAREYGPNGVRANCVAPGVIDAGITNREITDPEERTSLARLHSLQRLGRPEEVAEAIVWLASSASTFTTGSTLLVDGGFLA